MDFTGLDSYDVEYSVDPFTGNAVFTFKQEYTDIVVGEIKVEHHKARGLIESFNEIVRSLVPKDYATWNRRTEIDRNAHTAKTRLAAPL